MIACVQLYKRGKEAAPETSGTEIAKLSEGFPAW
jgi:hypothetical protein